MGDLKNDATRNAAASNIMFDDTDAIEKTF